MDEHRLLFILGDVVGDREVVDIDAERLRKGLCDDHERVAVVALAGIEDAGDAVDITEGEAVVAVLRAPGGESEVKQEIRVRVG